VSMWKRCGPLVLIRLFFHDPLRRDLAAKRSSDSCFFLRLYLRSSIRASRPFGVTASRLDLVLSILGTEGNQMSECKKINCYFINIS
jgi:hypothetical protein